ncbi:MAG: hypothetical protein OIN66_08500 [Candidatus Methanoperedens sp.]|nr:hypothetical protein [Candidatus Methanoperedens sp.]
MNDKETKVPIYIAIIVALILVGAAGYYVLGKPSPTAKPDDVKKTPIPAQKETPAATAATTSSAALTPGAAQVKAVETIKCELCHKDPDPKDLAPHVNGGKLCMNCHGSQVHNIHIGSGTVNLNCDTCHGFPPKIPTVEKGEGPGHYSVCEQCHAPPPDNTKPSNGNLILIHLSRGKYCTNCHGTDIGEIHKLALANTSKK